MAQVFVIEKIFVIIFWGQAGQKWIFLEGADHITSGIKLTAFHKKNIVKHGGDDLGCFASCLDMNFRLLVQALVEQWSTAN